MSIIEESCKELLSIYDDCNRDKMLKTVARKKLIRIYEQENEEFETLLDKLDKAVDYSDVSNVKKCVTKLMRLLSMNRKTLMNSIERLCD